ncbi:MAG: lipid A biosynthesis acyltransferase [Desulfuromonas sp.]|uniref:lysophospholipid acyltransferase family protein n=1 Tax=Desulfuromonas sp. TaxID=892 RepID=UPI000CBEBE68|nr:lysophospholipid acyltransferase family protein [Desulfuromonas sp.]PLX85237.1 MAG: lipid A biosynthesis acyltransferase [Desulfuromonas sp.]
MRRPEEQTGAGEGRQWTSRSLASSFQHQVFYLLIRVGGRPAAYLLLRLVVLYYVLLRPSVRARSAPYLSRRFPGAGLLARLGHSYRMSLALGKVLVDRAVVGILGPGQMEVELHGREELLELLAEGRGLVMVNAHAGCWQVAMSALSFLKEPVNMLMRREDGDVDRQYFEHAGVPCPYRVIDPDGFLGGTLEMMAVLKEGQVLCVMGDRVLGSERSTVGVDFLGDEARFPVSAFKVASATGAPVGVLLSYKTGPRSYELKLAGTIRVPPDLGRSPEALRPYAARFVGMLEDYVAEHPYQFFNFFDMWQGSENKEQEGDSQRKDAETQRKTQRKTDH